MYDSLWQAVLGEIELSVSRGNFATWFKNTRLLKYKDNVLVIGVANVFIKGQLERKYASLLAEVLQRNNISVERVEYKIQSGLMNRKKSEDEEVLSNPTLPKTTPVARPTSTAPVSHAYRQGLNERYTFDSFIVGSGNELAYAACQAVASQPGTKYNPLFLYGGVGIGKTHLIQAVGNAIATNKPGSRVVYATIEQFVQEFLDGIRYKKVGAFAEHYRGADVLIVDDIQFIAGKEKTQEEFFHTFNALHQANKQIIISSDRPPKDIPTLEDRLRSRFSMGMTIDMQAPDFETRCAILQTKAHSHNIVLPKEVVEYLSQLSTNNVRELEGTLNQLLAHCEMRKVAPSIEVVSEVFGASRQRTRHISPRQIVEKTARYYSLPVEEMLGPKRDKEIVLPRQVAMYLMRTELSMSFPKIAHELGRKDHTTAIHSIEKMGNQISNDNDLQQQVNAIKERLYA